MRFKKILLINPSVYRARLGPIRPPVGLGYVAQFLNHHGLEYEVIDMALGHRIKDLFKEIDMFMPELIGISMWTYGYKYTYNFIRKVKERYPEIPVLAGGPHISTMRQEVLKECREIDFAIVLEGEKTIIELCQGIGLENIKGLIYRKGKDITYNGDREFVVDLDSIPFPRFERFERDKYMLKEMLIISSRGCPFNCIYCPVSLAIGKRLRVRSARNVVDEIVYWYNKGYRRFNFGDDNFTFYKERVYEICDEIEKRDIKGLDIRCGNGIRADRVDRALLKRMKDVGFTYLAFGVEGGNDRILGILKKGEDIKQIEETIRDACEIGFDVTLFFLAGSPGEKWEDIEDSVQLARRYPIIDARFYNIIPYPSTQLFEDLKRKNLFVRSPEEYLNDTQAFDPIPVFETPELSVDDRIKVFRYLSKVSKEILRNGFKKKLKRYGWAGILLAYVASTDMGQNILRHNKIIRRIAEKIRYRLR